MKIAVIDDSKVFLKYIKQMLNQSGFKEIFTFSDVDKFLEFIKNNEVDVIFIDYIMPKTNGISLIKKIKEITPNPILIMLTSSKDENIKKKALLEGIDDFINKDIPLSELIAKMNMIKKLVNYKNIEKDSKNILQAAIEYKNYQEKSATLKQKILIKNDLKNFFENDNLFENYYKSQDILNGDALFTIYLSKNHYIVGIIDAMGKGLSASLTSINSVTFMEYSIKKAIEYRDFDFRRLIKDFLNYTKSILIKEEILCGIILNVKNDTIEYANFGMPPIYTNEQKYLANNPPISKRLENFYINKFSLPEKFIILSDGLIESNLKQSGIPYYANFKKLYKKINFLKELITDFKNNANQTDDISVIFFKKDKINNKIFEIEKKIHDVKDVDEILTQIYISDLHQDSLTFILQEILMNTLEHSLYNLKEKKINKTINDAQKIKDFVKIKITFYKQDGYLKVHYAEDSEGFDKNEIDIDPKYHGRGLKIVKHLADGFYMNLKGNEIKIFLKEKDEKRD